MSTRAPTNILYKNGTYIGATGSRIVVSNPSELFGWKLPNVKSTFLQIPHLDAGDTVELRITEGYYVHSISLNIQLTGLGFDFHVYV